MLLSIVKDCCINIKVVADCYKRKVSQYKIECRARKRRQKVIVEKRWLEREREREREKAREWLRDRESDWEQDREHKEMRRSKERNTKNNREIENTRKRQTDTIQKTNIFKILWNAIF